MENHFFSSSRPNFNIYILKITIHSNYITIKFYFDYTFFSLLQVMKQLTQQLKPTDNVRVTLVCDTSVAWYSGMLPGCIAQLYQPSGRIDLHVNAMAFC